MSADVYAVKVQLINGRIVQLGYSDPELVRTLLHAAGDPVPTSVYVGDGAAATVAIPARSILWIEVTPPLPPRRSHPRGDF